MRILDQIISDRGSRYAASGGPCVSAAAATALVAELKTIRKFAKATHHCCALLCAEGALKADRLDVGKAKPDHRSHDP